MTDTQISTTAVVEQLKTGAIVSYADLVERIASAPTSAPIPAKVAVARPVTAGITHALEVFTSVYGSVVPDEVRTLQPAELTLLATEREALDLVEKVAKARKDDIRTTVLNHHDLTVGGTLPEGSTPLTEKDGHLVVSAKYAIPGSDKCFSVEAKEGSPSVDAAALKALAEDPDFEAFTHADYLACTEQTRVLDENKALLHLRKNPEALEAFKAATSRSTPSVTFTTRKV
jgi:hypothetical protein